ncbi:MAG TPA: DUF1800 family protein [Chthoniobacterales bacterium]|jgi:uncharacterized protein (DUF1800 family)
MRLRFFISAGLICLCAAASPVRAGIDRNGNQQSDVWEMLSGATGLPANGDEDNDGFSNRRESIAGTDPRSGASFPSQTVHLSGITAPTVTLRWPSLAGKAYAIERSASPGGPWESLRVAPGTGQMLASDVATNGAAPTFFRVGIDDVDSDGDGVSDWEELALGFDPTTSATDRYFWRKTPDWQPAPYYSADYNRIAEGLGATNVVSVGVVDADVTIGWPDPGVIAIRRSGGLNALTVPITLGGTAVRGTDYDASVTTSVSFPPGAREATITLTPRDTSTLLAPATITVTLGTSSAYTQGSVKSGTVTVKSRPPFDRPSAKAAARFLVQAAFGPDEAEIAKVQALGFAGWIDDQFTRPIGLHQPDMVAVDQQIKADNPTDANARAYGEDYQVPWWNQAMKAGSTADPLRQRVAYALSQIVVISDKVDAIGFYPVAMANFYDMLLQNAFGNYRNVLYGATLHPCMGAYLSHLRNAKEDPSKNLFPDENYAREVMQLFSIGLWELNPDGTRRTGANGQPIPTYDNTTIRSFAKVFTGLTLKKIGGSADPAVRTADDFFWTEDETYAVNMEMWDLESWVYRPSRPWETTSVYYHDRSTKTLLNGVTLPANQRGLKDISDAIDNIFAHANVGPFVCRQLIQRFVTSNPSPAYIQRVAAVFTANKANPQQMRLVIRAILLDDEARNPAKLADVAFGKQREPFLRIANLIKAFDATAANGKFELRYLDRAAAQRPLSSPSVFNFYLPDYQPPGELTARGLVAPEFQITNDITLISNPNYAFDSVTGWREWTDTGPTATYHLGDFNIWGSAYPEGDPRHDKDLVLPDTTAELALANDPDALIRRLDLLLTYGNLSPRQHQIIRDALERITPATHNPTGYPNDYLQARVETAIYLISTSPEFCILK